MRGIEELKSMTQEDLVRLVQEQNEKIESLKKSLKEMSDSKDFWSSEKYAIERKYDAVIAAIKGVLVLTIITYSELCEILKN